MRSDRLRFTLVVSVIGATFLLVACGGDDGGSNGGGGAVSVEEFCDRIAALQSAAEPDDIGSAVAALEGLVDSAPTAEVRNALETLVPLMSKMSEIDENDPDAVGELMGLFMDSEVMEASTVLEEFGAEQCGFSSEDAASSDTLVDPASSAEGIGASDMMDFLTSEGREFLAGGSITSVSVENVASVTKVAVVTSETDGVDALALCRMVLDFYDSNDPGVDVSVEIATAYQTTASREPGGSCES